MPKKNNNETVFVDIAALEPNGTEVQEALCHAVLVLNDCLIATRDEIKSLRKAVKVQERWSVDQATRQDRIERRMNDLTAGQEKIHHSVVVDLEDLDKKVEKLTASQKRLEEKKKEETPTELTHDMTRLWKKIHEFELGFIRLEEKREPNLLDGVKLTKALENFKDLGKNIEALQSTVERLDGDLENYEVEVGRAQTAERTALEGRFAEMEANITKLQEENGELKLSITRLEESGVAVEEETYAQLVKRMEALEEKNLGLERMATSSSNLLRIVSALEAKLDMRTEDLAGELAKVKRTEVDTLLARRQLRIDHKKVEEKVEKAQYAASQAKHDINNLRMGMQLLEDIPKLEERLGQVESGMETQVAINESTGRQLDRTDARLNMLELTDRVKK